MRSPNAILVAAGLRGQTKTTSRSLSTWAFDKYEQTKKKERKKERKKGEKKKKRHHQGKQSGPSIKRSKPQRQQTYRVYTVVCGCQSGPLCVCAQRASPTSRSRSKIPIGNFLRGQKKEDRIIGKIKKKKKPKIFFFSFFLLLLFVFFLLFCCWLSLCLIIKGPSCRSRKPCGRVGNEVVNRESKRRNNLNYSRKWRRRKKRGKGVRLFSSSSSVRGQQTGMRGGDEDIPQPKQSITILNTRAIFNRAIHTSSSSSFFSFFLSFYPV